MTIRRIVFALFAAALTGMAAGAKIPNAKHITDSLYNRLNQINTPADSLHVMGNLFDVLPRPKSTEIGMEMFHVANRAGDSNYALEMLRNLANRYIRNDSMLVELYNLTLRYNNGDQDGSLTANPDELKETRTFLKMTRNMHQAIHADEDKRNELLHEQIQTNTLNPPSDIYSQIVLLHSICTLLARTGSDDLLTHYLDELGRLVEKLPPSAVSIHNAYYVHAAVIYSENNQYEKSVLADKRTLKNIDYLEKIYRERGRRYRNYDANRYIIYQRFS